MNKHKTTTHRARRARLVGFVAAGLLALPSSAPAANPQPDPPSTPPDSDVVAAFDRLEGEVASFAGLNRGERQSFVAKLETSEAEYRRGRACVAAERFRPFFNEAKALERSGRPAGAELRRRGFALRQLLLGRLPAGVACKIGVDVVVDASLVPVLPTLAGEPTRPLARVVDQRGNVLDFVANEVVLIGDPAVAASLAQRWGGVVMESLDVGTAVASRIRVEPRRSDGSSLAGDLQTINGGPDGIQAGLQVSSPEGVGLLAIAAAEAKSGLSVGINPVTRADSIAGGSTTEAPTGPTAFGDPIGAYSPNAFSWNHLRPQSGPNDATSLRLNVTKAWQLLERADRLTPTTRIHLIIHDSGFSEQGFEDVPAGSEAFSDDIGVPNGTDCSGGNPCPWHGTMAMSAAAAGVDDGFGGAGPAGVLRGHDFRVIGREMASNGFDTAYDASGSIPPPDIFSMSYSADVPAALALFLAPLELIMTIASDGGVTMFAAAGNDAEDVDATDCIAFGVGCWEESYTFPCESAGVICVGALGQSTRFKAPYSNWGDEDVDIFGPGELLVGPDPATPGNIAKRGGGTSSATPFVAGVAALLMASDPRLIEDEDTLRSTLLATASDGPGRVRRVVDADAAVRAALNTMVRITSPAEGATIPRGQNTHFSSFTYDRNGHVPTYEWTSDRDGLLSTSSTFDSSMLSFGEHRITLKATFANFVVSDAITVTFSNTAPVVTMVSPAQGTTFQRGATIQLRATSYDANQIPYRLPDSAITWRLDGTPIATGHVATFALGSTPPGPHLITVRGTDGELEGRDAHTITVGETEAQAPDAFITSPPDGTFYVPTELDPATGHRYQEVTLTGEAHDLQDGAMGPANFTWFVSVNGGGLQPFATGTASPTYRITSGARGNTYDFKLRVTDRDGNAALDHIRVRAGFLE